MDILELYRNRLKSSENFCFPHWDRFIDNYSHYFSKLSLKKGTNNEESQKLYPFASRVTMGISFEVIETILPRIIGKDPEFIAIATEPEDEPSEKVANVIIDYEYHNPKLSILGEPIYLKLQKMVKEALITGTAVGRVFWRRENILRTRYTAIHRKTQKEIDVSEIDEYLKETGLKNDFSFKKKKEKTLFLDDFDLKHLPFFFFFPDPLFSEAGRMRYKIERDFYTLKELLEEAEIFQYDKKAIQEIIDEKRKQNFTPDISKDWLYRYHSLFSETSINSELFADTGEKIEALIVDKMWEKGKVFVFINEKYCLTPEGIPSPYDVAKDPFIFTYNLTSPHSFYGRSEIDAFKKIEDNMNDLTNMRNDNLFQSMSSFYLLNPNVFEDPDSFIPYPNSIYRVRDIMAALREVKGQDVTAGVYKETAELYNQIQRISGVNDYVKGAEGITLAGRTYGGLRLAQEVANVRFLIKSTLFEQVTLRALGYFILELSRQFINKEKIVRLFGKRSLEFTSKFYQIQPEELKKIKGFMDIMVIPSSTRAVDEQAEVMKLNSLLDRMSLGRPPFDRMTPTLYDKFLLKYLPLFGFKDAYDWIRSMKEGEEKEEGKEEKIKEKRKSPLPLPTEEILTSAGIQKQPSPLAQILQNQTEMVNQIPTENLV